MSDSGKGVGGRLSSLRMPRSRGAASGLLLIIAGAWGALAPFVGPYFDFAYTPDQTWAWSSARGVLEVLPGVITVLGGLLLLASRNRATAMFGGWLAVFAGVWFVVGRAFASALPIGDIGSPVGSSDIKRSVVEVAYFSGLGALIIFLGAAVLGRLSVQTVRDVKYARDAAAVETSPTTGPTPAATGPTPAAGGTPPPPEVSTTAQTQIAPTPGGPAPPASPEEPTRRGVLARLRRNRSTSAAR